MLNDRERFKNQSWYMEIMAGLGYNPPPNGICYAIEHLGITAGLLKEFPVFNNRFRILRDLYESALLEAQKQFELEIANSNNTGELTADKKFAIFKSKIKQDFEKLEKEIQTDVLAFFDFIEVEYNAIGDLIPTETESRLNASAINELMNSIAVEKKGGLQELGSFCVSLQYNEAVNYYSKYFHDLYTIAHSFSASPFGILLSSNDSNHTISLVFYPDEKLWVLTDAENLPPIEIRDEDQVAPLVLKHLFNSISKDGCPVPPVQTIMNFFTLGDNIKNNYEMFSVWKAVETIHNKIKTKSSNTTELSIADAAERLSKITDQCQSSQDANSIISLIEITEKCLYRVYSIRDWTEYAGFQKALRKEIEAFSDIDNYEEISKSAKRLSTLTSQLDEIIENRYQQHGRNNETRSRNTSSSVTSVYSFFSNTMSNIASIYNSFWTKNDPK